MSCKGKGKGKRVFV